MESNSSQSLQDEELVQVQLDPEWIELLMIARNMGITQEEIRNFLLHT